jgi:hypothetical protein
MITGMHGKVMPCNRIPKKMLWCEYIIEVVDAVCAKTMARDPHETS